MEKEQLDQLWPAIRQAMETGGNGAVFAFVDS